MTRERDFFSRLSDPDAWPAAPVLDEPVAEPPPAEEVVVDEPVGKARQAGTTRTDGLQGEFVNSFRLQAEASLYYFAKGVLGRDRLTLTLHGHACNFLQRTPPYRKLMLMPRDHYKTTIVGQCLPIHIHIQPVERNIYQPGTHGADSRILLVGETLDRAEKNVRWIQTQYEVNPILRSLWPHICWDNPRKQSKKWNATQILLPRPNDYADVSVQAYGADAATTGAHPNILIKDDIATEDAANSAAVMSSIKDWHRNSRALLDPPDTALEFISGTKWANDDVYADIMKDPTVEVYKRSIIEDGAPIMPEVYTLDMIEVMRAQYGAMFALLYMNEPCDPSLVDFDTSRIRHFDILDGTLRFSEDERDSALLDRLTPRERPLPDMRGQKLNRFTQDNLFGGRNNYVRLHSGRPRPLGE